jgi:hypothetical protein
LEEQAMVDIQEIHDASVVLRWRERMRPALQDSLTLNLDWIRAQRWTVVPTPSGRYFKRNEAARTARAIQRTGAEQIYAICLQGYGERDSYVLAPTTAGLIAFSDTVPGLDYFLTSENESYIILCTPEDYNLYAGPQGFVEACLGTDVQTARQRFREGATDPWGDLLAVAERYESV